MQAGSNTWITNRAREEQASGGGGGGPGPGWDRPGSQRLQKEASFSARNTVKEVK